MSYRPMRPPKPWPDPPMEPPKPFPPLSDVALGRLTREQWQAAIEQWQAAIEQWQAAIEQWQAAIERRSRAAIAKVSERDLAPVLGLGGGGAGGSGEARVIDARRYDGSSRGWLPPSVRQDPRDLQPPVNHPSTKPSKRRRSSHLLRRLPRDVEGWLMVAAAVSGTVGFVTDTAAHLLRMFH